MQRKNNFLKNRMQKKGGFAMIMAIAVIIIMATLMTEALSMSAKTTKSTVDLYIFEQAKLLSKSAAEYALLKIAKENNSTNPCHFTGANFKQDYYDINISVKYIYTANTCSDASQQYATVTTPEQNGSALMDIVVSVHDKKISSEPVSYFRRTIQKL